MLTLTKLLFLLLTVLVLSACGKGDRGIKKPGNIPHLEDQEAQGKYKAILRPINNQLSGFLPTGSAEIIIDGDEVEVKSMLDDDARVTHIQNIHFGTRCPDASDDKNLDGLIDIKEAYHASGEVFIPLDADLRTADEGKGIFPVGSGFTYVEATSLAELERDTKARTGQDLNLGGRVILIHGVNSITQMPSSVATRNGLSPQASIPIGCGILKRR